jgi:outer membrane lipoprotein-sorting protein
MGRRISYTGFLIAVLTLSAAAIAQSDFSAEVFDTQKSDSVSQAKMYISKDKIRIESLKKDARGGSGAIVMDLTAQTAIVVMDQQHMYMALPVQMANTRVAYTFFRAGDVENACTAWANSAKNKGGSCHKVGSDTVNGRSTVKYEGTNANGESSTFWIDPKIEFPVKWQTKNSSGELRNIQEGSLPANLFDIPAGYTKFDMGNMSGMQRPQ